MSEKGIAKFEFSVFGISEHASKCYDGASAIAEAANKILELEKYKEKNGITCNCGTIQGGTVPNVVPERCVFTLDVRFTDAEQYEDVKEIVNRVNAVPWSVLFDVKTKKPSQGYYTFVAFNTLYKIGTQVSHQCDTDGIYAVCAANKKQGALMVANISQEAHKLCIEGIDLKNARYSVIDDVRMLSWAPYLDTIEPNEVWLVEFDVD